MHRETPHTRGLELLFDAAASLPAPLLSAAIQLQLFIHKNQNPHSAGSASPPLLGPSECIVEHERQRLPQRRARRRRRQVNARPFVLSALNCFFIYGFWFFFLKAAAEPHPRCAEMAIMVKQPPPLCCTGAVFVFAKPSASAPQAAQDGEGGDSFYGEGGGKKNETRRESHKKASKPSARPQHAQVCCHVYHP